MKLLNKLYKLKRTLISDDNKVALNIIGDFVPLKIHRFKTVLSNLKYYHLVM